MRTRQLPVLLVAVDLSCSARLVDDNPVFSLWTWLPQPKAHAMECDAALAGPVHTAFGLGKLCSQS